MATTLQVKGNKYMRLSARNRGASCCAPTRHCCCHMKAKDTQGNMAGGQSSHRPAPNGILISKGLHILQTVSTHHNPLSQPDWTRLCTPLSPLALVTVAALRHTRMPRNQLCFLIMLLSCAKDAHVHDAVLQCNARQTYLPPVSRSVMSLTAAGTPNISLDLKRSPPLEIQASHECTRKHLHPFRQNYLRTEHIAPLLQAACPQFHIPVPNRKVGWLTKRQGFMALLLLAKKETKKMNQKQRQRRETEKQWTMSHEPATRSEREL